jgi:hypothetical protein
LIFRIQLLLIEIGIKKFHGFLRKKRDKCQDKKIKKRKKENENVKKTTKKIKEKMMKEKH